MAESHVVGIKKITISAALAIVAVFVLYDVSVPLDVASSYETEMPDPEVEAGYQRCYRQKDEAMHHAVFDNIDNPDVQKELISTNRERIARECRAIYPVTLVIVTEPAHFNIVDATPRFW